VVGGVAGSVVVGSVVAGCSGAVVCDIPGTDNQTRATSAVIVVLKPIRVLLRMMGLGCSFIAAAKVSVDVRN
jgi:hypothetical protein